MISKIPENLSCMGRLSPSEIKKKDCGNYKDYKNCRVNIPNPIDCGHCPNWEGVAYNSATDNSKRGTRGGETPQESYKIRGLRRILDPSAGE